VNPALLRSLRSLEEEILGKTVWAVSARKQPDGQSSKAAFEGYASKARADWPQKFDWAFATGDSEKSVQRNSVEPTGPGEALLLAFIE
jgi:hypothetical protein